MTNPTPNSDTKRHLSWRAVAFIEAPSSRVLMLATALLVTSFVACGVLSFYIEIDSVINAGGVTDFESGVKDAVAKTSGQVYHISVLEGEAIKKDQVVAWIRMSGTHEARLRALMSVLSSKLKNLNNPELKDDHFASSLEDIENDTLKAQLLDVQQKQTLLVHHLNEISDKTRKEIRPLKRRKQVIVGQLKFISTSGMKPYLTMQKQSLESEKDRIEQQISAAENQLANRIFELRNDSEKSIRQAHAVIRNYIVSHQIRAPVAGVVGRFAITVGTFVRDQEPVVTILPANSPIVAKIQVPSKDISKIAKDLKVYVSVDAYPSHKYGYFSGKVLSIEAVASKARAEATEENYAVRVSLDPLSIVRKPAFDFVDRENVKFIAGMKVDARIITRRSSLISLAYDKVFGTEK